MLGFILSLITETDNNNWRENYKKNLAEELAMEFEDELSEEVLLGDDALVGKIADNMKNVLGVKDSDEKKLIPVAGLTFDHFVSIMQEPASPRYVWSNDDEQDGVYGEFMALRPEKLRKAKSESISPP